MDWREQITLLLVEEVFSDAIRLILSILFVGTISLLLGGRRWLRGELFSGLKCLWSVGVWLRARTRCPAAFGIPASMAEISELSGQLNGMTELAATEFLRPHLGKRLSVAGPLLEAKGEVENVTAVTIEQPDGTVAVLLFIGQAKELATLAKGQNIMASGNLRELEPNAYVRLDNCQVEE